MSGARLCVQLPPPWTDLSRGLWRAFQGLRISKKTFASHGHLHMPWVHAACQYSPREACRQVLMPLPVGVLVFGAVACPVSPVLQGVTPLLHLISPR